MKIRLFFLIVFVIAFSLANTLFVRSNKSNTEVVMLSFFNKIAQAQSEGGGPSACGVVCCDYDVPFSNPPLHLRCEIICVPQYFCAATGGDGILCDFQYMSCPEYCGYGACWI